MKYLTLILALVAAQSLQADTIHEMDQTELRARVASGEGLRLGPIVQRVQNERAGVAVDVRAYGASETCDMYYRILLKGRDATMKFVVVDAKTGNILPFDAEITRRIGTSARSQEVTSAMVATSLISDDI